MKKKTGKFGTNLKIHEVARLRNIIIFFIVTQHYFYNIL